MNWATLATDLLLAIGLLCTGLCTLGVLVGRDTYQKLHFLGPLGPVAAVAIAAAVVVHESFSQASVKVVLVALILTVTNPVLTHATARAAALRGRDLPPVPAEREKSV